MASNPMGSHIRHRSVFLLGAFACLVIPWRAVGEPIPVRKLEKPIRATMSLRGTGGTLLANGRLEVSLNGDRVTSRLTFNFKDGSIQDQTTVFSQRGHFTLISDRLIQKGPSFAHPLEMTIDTATGQVTVTYTDGGKQQTASEHLQLPADLANGMLPVILKNLDPSGPPTMVSLIATTPEPRLVRLRLSPAGTEPVTVGGVKHRATHFVIRADIGGAAGVLAPLVGKQPPDTHVWVLGGDSPAFLKSEGPLFYGGAPWRIEVTSPVRTAK
jgi:hypothetical protein